MEKVDEKVDIQEEKDLNENVEEKLETNLEAETALKNEENEKENIEEKKDDVVETQQEIIEEADKADTIEEKPTEENGKMEDEQFENLLEESLGNIKNLEVGDQVEGQIIKITDSYIFVSLGGKRDAYAEKADYQDKEGNLNVKVGDNLKGYVVKCSETETFIAKSLVSVNKSVLKEAFEQEIPVNGKVNAFTKGGFIINISNVRAFCPKTHIDYKKVIDVKNYIGNNYDFRIIDFKENGRDIVVSRKVMLREEADRIKKETLKKLEVGSTVKGKITRLTNFGAFVNLGGIEGLLHISELSWARVESPSEVVSIGEEIDTKIIKIDGEKISLSIKALLEDPFDIVIKEMKEGDIVKCRVLRNLPFGSFVEIKPGVEGLVPVSEMARGRRINNPSEVLQENDYIEVQVLKINAENKKISLSLKALQPDPWDNIYDIVNEDEIVTGVIENVVNFGAFIKLKEGIVGLMPNSKIKIAGIKIDKSNIGEEFSVKIASVDPQNKRISLEPTNMPENAAAPKRERDNNDWRHYKTQSKKEINDSPFADL